MPPRFFIIKDTAFNIKESDRAEYKANNIPCNGISDDKSGGKDYLFMNHRRLINCFLPLVLRFFKPPELYELSDAGYQNKQAQDDKQV